jgi:hypothetical protein
MFTSLQVGNHEIQKLDLLIFNFPGWFAQNSFYYDSFKVIFQYFFTTPFTSRV